MQFVENVLWKEVLKHNPKVWIWGGDNVYSDTDDMTLLKADYDQQLADKNYQQLISSVKLLGTWDDHDYGLNDGGVEFSKKQESQQEFLDFMGVSKTDVRRTRGGVYHSETLKHKKGKYYKEILNPDAAAVHSVKRRCVDKWCSDRYR